MPQCPNCHTEVKAEERFCPNCGSRLEQRAQPPTSSATDISKPDRSASPPAGNQTIVLPAVTDAGKTMRLPESQPSPTVRLPEPPTPPARLPENQPPARPAVDATIVAGMPAPPPTSPASDATFVGNPGQPASSSEAPAFGAPPLPPSRPASDATYVGDHRLPSAPSPAAGGPQGDGGTLPSASVAPPQAGKTGSARLWKILAIVAGLGVLACVALIAGVLMLAGDTSSTAKPTAAAAKTTQATAAARPTAAPAPTAAADSSAVLLRDDFDNPSRSGFKEGETDNAIYQFTDGGFAISVKKPELIIWNSVKGSYKDASIEVETTLDGPDKSATGLIFRYQDDKNFYLFTVAGDGNYSLDFYKDDKLNTLIDWTDATAINGPGERNTLRVETVGDTIRLFVNDELLDEISDDTFSAGKMAIVATTFDDPDVTVTFDNLIIRDMQ